MDGIASVKQFLDMLFEIINAYFLKQFFYIPFGGKYKPKGFLQFYFRKPRNIFLPKPLFEPSTFHHQGIGDFHKVLLLDLFQGFLHEFLGGFGVDYLAQTLLLK